MNTSVQVSALPITFQDGHVFWLACACHCCSLRFTVDEDGLVFIERFTLDSRPIRFRERLIDAWKALYGRSYANVVLHPEQIKRLWKFLGMNYPRPTGLEKQLRAPSDVELELYSIDRETATVEGELLEMYLYTRALDRGKKMAKATP